MNSPENPHDSPAAGSLPGGVVLAWLIMLLGEALAALPRHPGVMLLGGWLPPLAILVLGLVWLQGRYPRTGKGLLVGLLSIMGVLALGLLVWFIRVRLL